MAQLGQRFDATQHDTEQRDFAELPNGIYEMEIEASDVSPTKDGRGTILKVTMKVIRPEQFKDRLLFNNYNLENPNVQAQEIGQRQFASLCRAVGVDAVEDSEDLHFKAFTVKVGLGKPSKDGQYPARAEVKRYYFPDEGELPEPAIDENQPTPAPKAANDNRAPAANDNRRQESQPAPRAAGRPWGQKK